MSSDFNPDKMLLAAKSAAWRWTRKCFENWREDIASDIVLRLLELRSQGVYQNMSRACFDYAASHSIRALIQLLKCDEPLEVSQSTEASHELGPIALWRLQCVWDELTERQRLGLWQLLSGADPVETERAHGLQRGVLRQARVRALEIIDNPNGRSRVGKYSHTMPAKAVDAAAVERYKEQDKLRAREYRRAKRSA